MDLQKLVKFQEELAKSVVMEDKTDLNNLKFVVGVDQAFVDDYVISACIKLSYPELEFVDSSVVVEKVKFPYIPTFLMFREGMPAVRALRKLINWQISRKTDRNENIGNIDNVDTIIMVDGSGIAHPRKCGLATFIALKLKTPTIGITKKKLYGFVELPKDKMEAKPIYNEDQIVIGYSLKSCKRCKPIFISPGSYITPRTALKLVIDCIKKHKLPEPIRLAHNLASKAKLEMIQVKR